jgi:hypothetical protein
MRPSTSTPATVTRTGSSTRPDSVTKLHDFGCGFSSQSNGTLEGASYPVIHLFRIGRMAQWLRQRHGCGNGSRVDPTLQELLVA